MVGLSHGLAAYVDGVHELFDYSLHLEFFAQQIGLEVITYDGPSCAYLPDAKILLNHKLTSAQRRFCLAHEIAHYLIYCSGKESALRQQFDTEASFEAYINKLGASLSLPDYLLEMVDKMYGNTPKAIIELVRLTGASYQSTIYRWVNNAKGRGAILALKDVSKTTFQVLVHHSKPRLWRWDSRYELSEAALFAHEVIAERVPTSQRLYILTAA